MVRMLALALVLWPRPILAQPSDSLARTHFAAGSSYYEQGRYDDALREFDEAYRFASDSAKPRMLFNVAQTQERLGRLGEAIDSFRRYLEVEASAPDRALVEQRLFGLEERLRSTAIVLTVSEAGAAILVDGQARGESPLAEPIAVAPGAHEIRIEHDGFEPFALRVTVEPGQRVTTEATLVQSRIAEPVTPPPPPAPEPAPPPPPPPRRGRVFTWIAASAAGVLAIGGGALGLLALSSRDSANDAVVVLDPGAYDDEKSSAESLSLFADIAFGLALASAVTAVVLFLVEGGDDAPDERAALRFSPVALTDGAGLVLWWSP